MKLFLFFVAAILAALPSHAAEVRITDKMIPLIQDGGGWKTKITITNLETSAAPFEIVFRNGSNESWPLEITGPGVKMERGAIRHQLAPNTSLILETAGIGNAVQTGHAILYSLDNIKLGAKSVVRNAELKVSLTLPLSPEREDRLVLPFDNTDGAKTSFLWISETPYAMVDFVFLDPSTQKNWGQKRRLSPKWVSPWKCCGKTNQACANLVVLPLDRTAQMSGNGSCQL